MPQLTTHFSEKDLRVEGEEDRVMKNALFLCNEILEPIRDKFNCPVIITSGKRSDKTNLATGGVHDSQHLYHEDSAAVDFFVVRMAITKVFDWIRLESNLPCDQVILEKDKKTGEPTIIHVSSRRLTSPRFEALIGSTHGESGYERVKFLRSSFGKPVANVNDGLVK